MNIVAQSLSHRGEIAELFIRDAATILLHTLFAIWLQSVGSRYDQRASASTVLVRYRQHWRFCHASATLLGAWQAPGLVQVSS